MTSDWWREAVFYQIYPRSFQDTPQTHGGEAHGGKAHGGEAHGGGASKRADGVGDLPGVLRRLDHVADLGADAVWLSPFFASPMRDFGYDVSDYRAVDPVFGTMADFDAVLERAHALGLKLIIDQVYSHTSDEHDWFARSRLSREGELADWYVWADARADGGPPNNWLSVFGGPSWTWDARRRQYYLHNFLSSQPDLNFHQPAVREAILDTARFWLDKGVDGFRLDVANFYFHDARLRDNPPASNGAGARPYLFQRHLYDRSQPETLGFLSDLRAVTDLYPDRMMVAEVDSTDPVGRSIQYTDGPTRLHTAYSFSFLHAGEVSAGLIRRSLEGWRSQRAWPSWSFSNHDVARVASRWGGEERPGRARLLLALLLCLRGTPFLYQGEELGLPQADVPFDRLRDPEAIRFYPEGLGRDGCRTPMPWDAGEPHAGFSGTEPWLPIDARHLSLDAASQARRGDSTLAATRALLRLRKAHAALRTGAIAFWDAPEPLLAFERAGDGERLLCAFNLSGEDQALTDDRLRGAVPLDAPLPSALDGVTLRLPPDGGAVVTLPSYD